MEINDFIEKVNALLKAYNVELWVDEQNLILRMQLNSFVLSIKDFENVSNSLKEKYDLEKKMILTDNECEFVINVLSNSRARYFQKIQLDKLEKNNVTDFDNKITYKLSKLSYEYLLLFLSHDIRILRSYIRLPSEYRYRAFDRIIEENDNANVFDFLIEAFRLPLSVKIQSEDGSDYEEFCDYFESYRFQLAINFDIVIASTNIEKLLIDVRKPVLVKQKKKSKEFDAPKRIYIKEILNQYFIGLISENPFMEFVSYYHVLEYFFEKVYYDNLIKEYREQIYHPRYSLKDDDDIKKIIKFISKKVASRNEEYSINEKEALLLTLMNYTDINSIHDSLFNMDEQFIQYYKNNRVPFSNGSTINFDEVDKTKVYKQVTSRIYETRNAIVHSKANNQPSYLPFEDDEYLAKEIPLIKLLAESIIIFSSTII